MPITGVPPEEVGNVVQDFVDNGAAVVTAVREPGRSTYTVGQPARSRGLSGGANGVTTRIKRGGPDGADGAGFDGTVESWSRDMPRAAILRAIGGRGRGGKAPKNGKIPKTKSRGKKSTSKESGGKRRSRSDA
jgi:hypothetical protein